mgnify:CR=1 FL=1
MCSSFSFLWWLFCKLIDEYSFDTVPLCLQRLLIVVIHTNEYIRAMVMFYMCAQHNQSVKEEGYMLIINQPAC